MLNEKIHKAVTASAVVHAGQHRKGSVIPYISHPYSVMLYASEMTSDEDVLIAALLHDVFEDAPDKYSEADMRMDFGDTVTELVKGVTEQKHADEKSSWQQRKDAYLAHLETAKEGSVIISLADKTHNLRSTLDDYALVGDELWARFNAGKERQLWFYESVAAVVLRRLGRGKLQDYYAGMVAELREIVGA